MRPILASNKKVQGQLVRLGLIGAGRWGRAYIRTLAGLDGISLAWVASRNPETKSLVPAACTVTEDWRRVVTADDIDGVIVATPPASHAEISIAAIEQGRAIMVEKPLTLSIDEAEHLLGVAKERQIVALVDHIHLFHPAYCELKHRLGRIGPIREIRTSAGQWGPFRVDTPVLWDWAPHDIAMCLDLMNQSPENIKAIKTKGRQYPEGVGERYEISLDFSEGAKAHIEIGNDFSEKKRLLAVLTDDYEFIYDDCATNPLIYKSLSHTQLENSQIIKVSNTLSLTCALQEFADQIRKNTIKTDSLRLGVEVVRIISRCQDLMSATLSD